HPAYPDRANFGRVAMDLSMEAVEQTVYEQICALARFTSIVHVKPHGALYNRAAKDAALARAIARGAARFSKDVILVGLAGSAMLDAFREEGLRVAAEAFADRRYEPNGSLRSRQFNDALIRDPEEAAAQALRLVRDGHVQTICVHSDSPGALEILQKITPALRGAGIEMRSLAPL
ncbi:MAG: LamB/YcsF family protein, partial [Bryobacteraceae bacterium]